MPRSGIHTYVCYLEIHGIKDVIKSVTKILSSHCLLKERFKVPGSIIRDSERGGHGLYSVHTLLAYQRRELLLACFLGCCGAISWYAANSATGIKRLRCPINLSSLAWVPTLSCLAFVACSCMLCLRSSPDLLVDM